MATWSGTGAHNSNYTGTLTVTEQSYNVAGNTSTLAYSLVITGNSGYYYQDIGTTTQISINGSLVEDRYEQITMPVPSQGVSSKTICSGTVVVPHNADGTKTVTVWATIQTPTTQSYLPGQIKMPSGLNGSLTLTTIPRESTMTIPTMTVGSSATFTISANSTTFSHSITYSFGGLSGTAATAAAGVKTASWTPPTSFYNEMPYSTSGYVTLVLHTFSGGTEIGSKTYTNQIVNIPASVKPTAPTVTLTPVNSNAWLNSKGLYVGGYSKVKIDSSASPGTGSYISQYVITNDVTGSGASYTSGVLSAGSKTISVTVADTRGRTNFTTVYVYFQEYSDPKFSTFKAVRGTYSNGTWTSDAYGNHIRVQAVGSVSLSESGNVGTKTVKIGSTNPAATSGNYYYFTNTNAVTEYTITGTITDSVGNSASKTLKVAANPAASTLTIPTLTIGSAATLTIVPVSNTLSHKITYSFSGLSGTIATVSAGTTTASWTPPTSFYAKLPNATSGTVTIVLKTYSGSTETGSNSYNAKVNVGSSIKPTAPTVTISPVNSNAWFNTKGLYVGGYTKLKVQSSATAGTGATISSYTISGAFAATGSNVTSSSALSAGSKTVKVTATDSRGRTNSTSTSVTFLTYTNPAISTFKAVRGTYSGGSWTTNDQGNHIRVQAVGSVALTAQGNAGTITVKIGNTSPAATSGNYYYFTNTTATTAYTVTGSITDSVGNTTTRGLTVPTISVPFNVDVDLPGAGFGMIAQKAKTVEISQDWSLVANGKNNMISYLPYSWVAHTEDTAGYERIATITITGQYARQPFVFETFSRVVNVPNKIYLTFTNEASGTEPTISYIGYDGYRDTTAFIYKTGSWTWDLYIEKSAAGDWITVFAQVPHFAQARSNVTYTSALLTAIPSGATVANRVPYRPFSIISNQYYSQYAFGLNMQNSDIINANAIYWGDSVNARDEGLLFARSDSNYDVLYALDGDAYIRRNQSIEQGIPMVTGTRLLTTDDLYYKNGDTLQFNNAVLNGMVTSSTQNVHIGIPTPKLLTNITSVTVNIARGTLRGISGYLDSQSSSIDWLTVATGGVYIRSPNLLTLILSKDSAYTNVINNTPVSFYTGAAPSGLTLTFNA